MKVRGFARDENGRMIPPGMSEVVYRQSFLNGETLPSWLNNTGSTDTSKITPSAWGTGNPGGLAIATTAAIDSHAFLNTVPLDQSQYAAIAFEVKGLRFTGMYSSLLTFGVHSSATPYGGASLIQRETEDWLSFNVPGQGTTEYGRTGKTLRTLGESSKQHNLGFLYNCRTRTCVAYEDDPAHPFGTLDLGTATIQSGPVIGRLRLTAKAATIQSMKFAEVTLRVWPETA